MFRAIAALAFVCGFVMSAAADDGRVFVDGAGRHVAAITISTLVPDKLLGWTGPLREEEKAFLPPRAAALPVLGRLTGRANTANVETVLAAHPDIVIDLGDVDPTHVSLAERTQQQTGVPYLIFDGRLDRTPELYERLGALLGAPEKAAELAVESRRTLGELQRALERLPSAPHPRVYYARGLDGLETALDGSINTEMLGYVGAVNVARAADRHNTATVSLEQVLAWNPDVVISMDERFYRAVWTNPLWQNVAAVREKRVYLAPRLPFGWFDSPPAVNRLIGVRWLAAVLYPQAFSGDLREATSEFYRRFYHLSLNETQLDTLLKPGP
jgi:iron complex transport system substrate-binding protein